MAQITLLTIALCYLIEIFFIKYILVNARTKVDKMMVV